MGQVKYGGSRILTMAWCWLYCIGMLAMIAEIIVGNSGFFVPVLALAAFYVCVVFGWRRTLLVFAVLGSFLDLAVGRSVPLQLALLAVALLMAQFWRRHGDCAHPAAQVLPGVILGSTCGTLAWLTCRPPDAFFNLGGMLMDVSVFLIAAVSGAVLLPLGCLLLDTMGARLDVALFRQAYRDDHPEEDL